MMPTNKEWRHLKVGDRIRFVRMPWDANTDIPGYRFSNDLRRLYDRLIARKRSARVSEIDKHGFPWIVARFRCKNGTWEWHRLMIHKDDDSWLPVRSSRNPSS
jgi:hypothetical protein